MNLLKLVERQNKSNISAESLFGNQTPPVLSNDMDAGFIRKTEIRQKEDLGIRNNNLLLGGSEFPTNPINGQIFQKKSKLYIYKESE